MSLYDYRWAQQFRDTNRDPPFYGLLMALALGADTFNLEKLRQCWPEEIAELSARYHAPGGVLSSDTGLKAQLSAADPELAERLERARLAAEEWKKGP